MRLRLEFLFISHLIDFQVTTSMKEIISRFPHIAEQIFEELDSNFFIQCKVVSPSWKNFIEESKFSYIRLIKTVTSCSKKEVEKTLPKANLEETKRLASDVTKVYNELLKVNVYRPSLTLFDCAAKCGYLSVCQLMINSQNDFGSTPLDLAAENGHLSVCELLIGKVESTNQQNALTSAIKNGHSAICHLIIESIVDKRNINICDSSERTPLHFAAENNLLSVCQKLMEIVNESDPEDDDFNTPFHLAARSGHLDICRLFIGKTDDVNAVNGDGQTPFHLAASNGHLEVCNLIIESYPSMHLNLLDFGNYSHPFYWAATEGYLDVCKLFTEKIKEKNPTNRGNHSLLHWAAYCGHLEMCRYIIENVYEKNPVGFRLDTPLHLAAEKGHLEVCQLIVDNVSNKEPKNCNGKTPIQLASDSGHSSIVKILQAGKSKRIKLG